jgi:serine phosphatase RsbU (regulator of sigma subunit)/SAM-dependent methyltransferase
MPDHKAGHYIHGSDPEEQRRLALLNDLLNERSLSALRLEGGEQVIDFGSGLGQLSREIARVVRRGGTAGRVVGIEQDPDQLEQAKQFASEAGEEDLVEFRLGNALDPPLSRNEKGSFDIAHTRFLLEHVPEPQALVNTMVRSVRPGGRVILEDDDHDLLRLWPEVPAFEKLWRSYLRTYDQLGNDPYVGRRLISMLNTAGAEPVKNDMPFFGSCHGDPSFDDMLVNFIGLIEGAPEKIVEKTALGHGELEQGVAALREWGKRPDATLWYVTCWAEGRRKGTTPSAAARAKTATVRPRSKLTSMQFLIESAGDLNSSLRLDEVFQKIGERVRELVDCHLFCIALWNEKTQLLEHSYSLKFGEHIEQEGGFPMGTGISGSAAELRAPIRVPDVSKDPRYVRARHAEVEIRSELAVPLLVKDRLIGTLDLESQQLDAFTEEHQQIIVALASQIATALENARLYEELQEKEKRLDADLATARRIQKGLLPAEPRHIEGLEVGAAFAPARELSGDFYDFLYYPDGRIAFILGDVAGKSTAAALYGSLAVGMLRGYALEHCSEPAALLTHLNQELLALEVERRFVALGFALYNPTDSRLVVSSAGVPQPLFVRGSSCRSLDLSGVPLGGLHDARYEVVRSALQPGDLIAFFSDGLEECESLDGERLGDGRLAEFLIDAQLQPAQSIADGMLKLSTDFSGGSEVLDDRTVIILRAT